MARVEWLCITTPRAVGLLRLLHRCTLSKPVAPQVVAHIIKAVFIDDWFTCCVLACAESEVFVVRSVGVTSCGSSTAPYEHPSSRPVLTPRNNQWAKASQCRFPFDIICLIVEWVAITNRRDLPSLALVNRLFFDAADLWIWRDVSLRTMPNSPFDPIQRRLHILLGRLDRGKMMTNPQLHFDANLPEAYLEYLRTGVSDLLTRSSCTKGLTSG